MIDVTLGYATKAAKGVIGCAIVCFVPVGLLLLVALFV
jgi:hypothetical protein